MNSSCEALATCVPMEYREANSGQQLAAEVEESKPDPGELLEARLKEERRVITAQIQQEMQGEIQRARAGVAGAIKSFVQQREEYFREVESEVVSLASAIARRIIHRETQMDPHLLVSLVHYELEKLDAATSVRLVVSADTLGHWREAAATMPHAVEVVPDQAVASGDLRIETALGNTSVNFESELKEIEHGFFDLLSHRPTAESQSVRVQ